jgi:hypothetical protein
LCVCVCVGEIISLPWFSKELKNDLSKNNYLRGVILILLVRESIFVGWGSPFPIVLVPRYKLSLCHTPITPMGCMTMWSRGSHHLYQSLAPLIRLYPFEIFVSCCFCKNSLVSNFFFSLILQHIKKQKNSYFVWLLSKIYQ